MSFDAVNPDTPLYTLDPLARFSDRATDYAEYRPSYPPDAIATLLAGLGSPTTLAAADIGAGTGISSRLLADQGVQVIAIEPNLSMAEAAIAHPLVKFRQGTAEQTGLPDACVDLVACFQAFHWFEPALSLAEFGRILKPSGRLALVWNDRDRTDPFTQAYSKLVRTASNQHPAESKLQAVDPLMASPHFTHIRHFVFRYQQALDLPGLLGRARSVSYMPKEATALEQLCADLTALYNAFADEQGQVYLVYQTHLYLGDPQCCDR